MPTSSDPEAPRLPGEAERAAFAERGFALVRGWLPRESLATLRHAAPLELPGARAAIEGWLGGELRGVECELRAVAPGAPDAAEWRQEYGCALRGGELRPFRHAALIGLGAHAAQRTEVELAVGSHRAGRLAHRQRAGVSAALPDRAQSALADRPTLTFELGPGDALFFHANLLHRLLPATGARELCVARFDVGD